MFASWGFTKSTENVPETTHIDIQDDIKTMITETIQKALPQVKNLKFDRFWTQNLGPKKLKATFLFSFENGAETTDPARYGIEGHAILDYDAEKDIWNVQGPYFVNNEVIFKDGLLIKPGQDDGE